MSDDYQERFARQDAEYAAYLAKAHQQAQQACTPMEFAGWLRKVSDIREASWDENAGVMSRHTGLPYGAYQKHYGDPLYSEAGIPEVWWPIFDCLLTAGYCEMWDFCDTVLGKEERKD